MSSDATDAPFKTYMKQIFLRRLSFYSERNFVSKISMNKITYKSNSPVLSGDKEYNYYEAGDSTVSEDYFDYIYKRGESVEQNFSLIFQLDRNTTNVQVRSSSYLAVLRNFGALFATLYVIGSLISKGMSQNRQEKSLVKRTYQTKILTDKEMNTLLGMDTMPEYSDEEV